MKFCVKCGREFEAVGREVICPSCKAQAVEDAKRAAVMKAKAKSWAGESVPVRISGRASTIIRRYGAANGLPFAQALDELLKNTDYFKGVGVAWQDVEPYRSRRRDKHATESTAENEQDAPQGKPQDVQEVKTASKPQEVKPQEVKAAKTSTSKQAAKKAVKTTSKPSKPASVKKEG